MLKNNISILMICAGLASCSDDKSDSPTPAPTSTDSTMTGEIDYTKAGLTTFLETLGYQAWKAVKATYTSPIHGRVKTYFNNTLAESLATSNTVHAMESMAVKELLSGDDEIVGHAVSVKITANDDANSWVWYEVTDSGTDIYGIGHTTCTGCHSGKDQISDYVTSTPD